MGHRVPGVNLVQDFPTAGALGLLPNLHPRFPSVCLLPRCLVGLTVVVCCLRTRLRRRCHEAGWVQRRLRAIAS
jgi:hypothetical protein